MNKENLIDEIIDRVKRELNSNVCNVNECSTGVNKNNYPLGEKMPQNIYSQTGKQLSSMTLQQVINGELKAEDMRVSKETLLMQAEVSESVGNYAFARNLKRAAELIAVPDEKVLNIYNALRPYRSTKEELYKIADELEFEYNCIINAKFIREATDVCEKRGKLRKV